MATVLLTAVAATQVAKLPLPIRARVAAIIERLEKWPAVSGAKPLKGALAGHYRIRTGDYRVQFYLAADAVVIEKVGHRDGFYRDGI
jgi:mRNA-degrading endonuclease RelE of RelBE toxin-antitoxin system